MPDPIVFSDMVSTADGKTLLLTHPNSELARRNVSLFSSGDGGASWTLRALLDDGPSQYSSLAVLPNGSVAAQWNSGCQHPFDADPDCAKSCAGVSMKCNGCHSCPDKPGQSGCYKQCGSCPKGCVHCHRFNASSWEASPACDKAMPAHDKFAVLTLPAAA